jgi:NADPH:quinone reductase-like Zn-dependent oxidoreductase
MPSGAPDIPGPECSGTVVKLAAGVIEWRVGDQVCAQMVGDGYGEYAAVASVQCLRIPAGVSLVDAGGLPETFCTVWTNVFERMRLQAGEVFLVQGASSGIGVTAIQLGKTFGVKVLATAGSDEKCQACRDFAASSEGVNSFDSRNSETQHATPDVSRGARPRRTHWACPAGSTQHWSSACGQLTVLRVSTVFDFSYESRTDGSEVREWV